MTEKKKVAHFNKGTVWGRVDGVPTRKLSGEGKGRPYYRIKVVCASQRGNVLAYGRIWSGPKEGNPPKWNETKPRQLIDYLKKNPSAGIKLVGFLNQYDDVKKDKKGVPILDEVSGKPIPVRYSNFTWYDWFPDKCEDPRAAFVLVGQVKKKQDDMLRLHLERPGSDPEDFEIYALDPVLLMNKDSGGLGVLEDDVVQVKGYLMARNTEDEFGAPQNDSPIRPYFDMDGLQVRAGDFV